MPLFINKMGPFGHTLNLKAYLSPPINGHAFAKEDLQPRRNTRALSDGVVQLMRGERS